MNYKERFYQVQQMPTLEQVYEEKKQWVTTHTPYDRGTKLPLFQYILEEGSMGALVPLGQSSMPQVYLKEHAFNQMANKLHYQRQLFDRLPGKLNLLNINWLIQHGVEPDVLLRIQDENQCRAMMSSRFQPVDDAEVLEMLMELEICRNARVTLAYDDEFTFHLSLVFPNTATEIVVGDVIECGILVSNSEVGLRSLTLAGYVDRLKCTNGMYGRGGDGGFFRFRHIGDHDRIRDAAKAAIDTCMLEATTLSKRFKDSLLVAVNSPADALMAVAKANELSQEEYRHLLDNFMDEPDKSLFGIVNAVSATGRDLNGEDAYKFGKLAGDLIWNGLPPAGGIR